MGSAAWAEPLESAARFSTTVPLRRRVGSLSAVVTLLHIHCSVSSAQFLWTMPLKSHLEKGQLT